MSRKGTRGIFDGKGRECKVVAVLFSIDHHVMRAYWGSRGIAPLILVLGSRWR
jgi:hypothetical protein